MISNSSSRSTQRSDFSSTVEPRSLETPNSWSTNLRDQPLVSLSSPWPSLWRTRNLSRTHSQALSLTPSTSRPSSHTLSRTSICLNSGFISQRVAASSCRLPTLTRSIMNSQDIPDHSTSTSSRWCPCKAKKWDAKSWVLWQWCLGASVKWADGQTSSRMRRSSGITLSTSLRFRSTENLSVTIL